MEELQIFKQYAPYLYFDKKEPFFPVRIGSTLLHEAGASPSFRRSFSFTDSAINAIRTL